jgi:hypothetical protein
MSNQRRSGGKENLMNLSLRNLLRNHTGSGAARKRSRPTLTTRLQVEQLEQRLVPTVNLSNMEIGYGKGVPFVQTEQINGGQPTYQGLVNEAPQQEHPMGPVHPPAPIHPSEPV